MLRGWGDRLEALRLNIKVGGTAMLFGLGYVIGLRYSAVIAAGSILSQVVMVPLVFIFGSQLGHFHYLGGTYDVAHMGTGEIFAIFVRPVGIGAIAVSGLIGLVRMGKIIAGSVSLGFRAMGKKGGATVADTPRIRRDMHPKSVILIQLASMLAMGVLFYAVSASIGGFTAYRSALFAIVGMLVGFAISFLFTPVAAQAIAIVGTNPVSGMTLITLVVACSIMVGVGLSGNAGMFISLVIGTAVCTALSTSGGLITDFKIGYWIGSTPRNQQMWKFAGIVLAALTVAFIIPLMDQSYHFLIPGTAISNTEVLPAPQANMLAVITKGLMSHAPQPILLYCLGGLVAILLYMAGVPMLAFSLGMYLPISITMGQLAGGFAAWLIGRTGKTKEEKDARAAQGSLIASGLMAGAAIIGILTAVTRLVEVGAPIRFFSFGERFSLVTSSQGNTILQGVEQNWFKGFAGQSLGLAALIILGILCYLLSRRGASWELADARSAEPAAKAD